MEKLTIERFNKSGGRVSRAFRRYEKLRQTAHVRSGEVSCIYINAIFGTESLERKYLLITFVPRGELSSSVFQVISLGSICERFLFCASFFFSLSRSLRTANDLAEIPFDILAKCITS